MDPPFSLSFITLSTDEKPLWYSLRDVYKPEKCMWLFHIGLCFIVSITFKISDLNLKLLVKHTIEPAFFLAPPYKQYLHSFFGFAGNENYFLDFFFISHNLYSEPGITNMHIFSFSLAIWTLLQSLGEQRTIHVHS